MMYEGELLPGVCSASVLSGFCRLYIKYKFNSIFCWVSQVTMALKPQGHLKSLRSHYEHTPTLCT